jgi:hypothetical protein
VPIHSADAIASIPPGRRFIGAFAGSREKRGPSQDPEPLVLLVDGDAHSLLGAGLDCSAGMLFLSIGQAKNRRQTRRDED